MKYFLFTLIALMSSCAHYTKLSAQTSEETSDDVDMSESFLNALIHLQEHYPLLYEQALKELEEVVPQQKFEEIKAALSTRAVLNPTINHSAHLAT